MVELNFDRVPPAGPDQPERGGGAARVRSRENGTLVLGSGLTYAEAMRGAVAEELPALAEASRTVGSPQIRNRGTIGGNLGTASPAGDALPPLLVEDAEVEVASVRGERRIPLRGLPRRREAERARARRAHRRPCASSRAGRRQTFMKVGPRNAMVIAVCSLALAVDRERGELRAAFGSAAPTVRLVTAPLDEAEGFPELVAARASPIDDVRGTAAYRRHCAPRAHPPCAREVPRVKIAAHRQRRAARDRRLGRREPPLRAARAARAPRLEERLRAGRVRLVLRAPRRQARLLVPRPRGPGRRARGRHRRGRSRRTGRCTGCRRRSSQPGAVQCGFCTPGLVVATVDLLRARARARRTTRSARRSRATSAAAPATRRSSTRSRRRRGR